MTIEIKVPELSESVVEATVAEWLKNVGDAVEVGDVLVILETDKVSLEVTAEQAGVLSEILRQADEDVVPGDVLGKLEAGEASSTTSSSAPQPKEKPQEQPDARQTPPPAKTDGVKATPVAQRVAQAHNIDIAKVATGESGKVTKADVENYVASRNQPSQPKTSQPAPTPTRALNNREERIRMSRRRRTIAQRLIEAQETAAMLTTFNEIDMSAVMELRKRRKEAFQKTQGVSLGLSSFFVKAVIGALKAFPMVNAEIDGDSIIMKHYYDIGMAIGAEEGLVVPVLRDADRMSFAEIETQVRKYAQQADEGTLTIESLMGGTFTITNGGVFGSMMSTPILNTPQVGILGLHGIKDRPVVVDGEIVIRPMMYVALTYDHRIIDGREAVQFLVKVKDLIEDPERLLLEG